jgi:hypothetical protein
MKRNLLVSVLILLIVPAVVFTGSLASPHVRLLAASTCGTGNSGSGNSGSGNSGSGNCCGSGSSGTGTGTGNSGPGSCSFTVDGNLPVPTAAQGNQDQYTYYYPPVSTTCDPATLRKDKLEGLTVSAGWEGVGLDVPAWLLNHFLGGTGTSKNYPVGSDISKYALASSAFKSVNAAVKSYIQGWLSTHPHPTEITLHTATDHPPGPLTTVDFLSHGMSAADQNLYWGFAHTQGLVVSGSGTLAHAEWTVQLTYVIEDSYGFNPGTDFPVVGPAMIYLQTICGWMPNAGGAHWFPDSITVNVTFKLPAPSP